jgi:hypothetical protein
MMVAGRAVVVPTLSDRVDLDDLDADLIWVPRATMVAKPAARGTTARRWAEAKTRVLRAKMAFVMEMDFMRSLLPLSIAVAVSCTVTEENFADRYARIVCRKGAKCDDPYFDARWDTQAECREETSEVWQELLPELEAAGCDIDFNYADACLADIRAMSCEEAQDDWMGWNCYEFLWCPV